jgi:hypothetical protein
MLDRDGRILARWSDRRGEAEGQFVRPYGIALDGQGNIYVTDYVTGDHGRLQAFRILSLAEQMVMPDR